MTYIKLQGGCQHGTWFRHDPKGDHEKIFADDSGLDIAGKVRKTVINDPNVYESAHRGDVLKRTGSSEKVEFKGHPYKLRFSGKQYGHLRIGIGARAATAEEGSLLKDCKEILSPKMIAKK
jgi:hypothetical protein